MKRLVLGALLAAVVLFAWGFLYWGLIPSPGFHEPSDEAALHQSLSEHLPESGAYYVPLPEGGPDSIARYEAGPIAFMFVRTTGGSPMPASMMIFGFIHMFITALLIGTLLRMMLPQLPAYGDRVLFVALIGIATAFWSDFSWPIWWRTPWTFFVWLGLYDVLAWTLAGTVLARFAKPKADEATPAVTGVA